MFMHKTRLSIRAETSGTYNLIIRQIAESYLLLQSMLNSYQNRTDPYQRSIFLVILATFAIKYIARREKTDKIIVKKVDSSDKKLKQLMQTTNSFLKRTGNRQVHTG